MQIKVENTNYVKDTKTNALLNTNRSVLLENEARKKLGQKMNAKNDEINNLKNQVSSMQEDMTEIKKMLTALLDKKN